MFADYFRGRRVFLTGHTGFKGSWLCEWLLMLGAEVHGYALDPQEHETLFGDLDLAGRLASDTRGDINDRKSLTAAMIAARPEVVLHLAAQPLVRLSYQIPVETFATNVMGTAHVLDALRQLEHPCAALCITTDKCYENREWLHAYREEDAMGGHDPYSASKGAAELVISSFRRSFFPPSGNIRLASARAGNVIGGGDWALDRIVPDCIRALRSGTPIPVRNKIATRPWQHVLEPLSGYLDIASRLGRSAEPHLQSAFNFGPPLHSNRTVAELVQELLKHLPGEWIDASDPAAVHEASKLNLATDKAFHLLGWHSVWDFSETLQITAQWYGKHAEGCDIVHLTRDQIQRYQSRASQSGLPWAMA